MRYTEELRLPIYDNPNSDLFKIQDWNEANQNIENKIKELFFYPVLNEEITTNALEKIDVRYPYCHVNRYGADDTGKTCSANAIQKAVDICEKLIASNKGIYPIRFEGKPYLITKTIQIKNKEFCKDVRPITFIGTLRKNITNNVLHGTTIIPKIPNHTGKDYANAFAININYDGDNNELDTTYFGGGTNAPICSNISFHNLGFELHDDYADLYNINVIKGYRYRSDLINIYTKNTNRLVWQPENDSNGGRSYCDFSNYKDINLVGIKTCGLELMTPDNSVIEGLTNHMIRSTANSVILIRNGGGIQINRFQHAFHFKEGTVGTTYEPRQDGTGANGTKALIKLANVDGISINSMYIERQLFDYAIYCDNSSNVTINNYYERFISNGFIQLRNKCHNYDIKNIHKQSNRVSGYNDLYLRDEQTDIDNILFKNFKCENWYSDTLSLGSNLTNLTPLTEKTKRNFKSNLTYKHINNVELNRIVANIRYTNNSWKIFDASGKDITGKYFNVEWRSNGITLTNVESNQTIFLKNVAPCYFGDSLMPYLPVIENTVNGGKIHFVNTTNNGMTYEQKEQLSVYAEIETLI